MSSQTNNQQSSSGDQYADELLDHNYDGIQEYDNPMPGWWKAIFYITIVWAAVYFVGINMGYIPTYQDDLERGQAELQAMRDKHQQEAPAVDAAMLAQAVEDEAMLADGKAAFMTNCASCHGQKGEGLIGPNLTDKYWLHGGELTDIHKVVKDGVTAKGMPAWGNILTQDEVVGVVAYIETIKGTNPPNAKEPQGEPVEGK
ncbi:c-type cytochrome [Persicimonas caeni]|uniref:C-type cytochrome n=1 Tax=Persicimonas caeni TaxID=2292766 RepID=A0A4Y6PZL1_PERCE|nr:cbb3-type cytochrome c oxidase N-terminal domain-containing protein [Persicimonas caeni]QDG53680.1 c-type cytochrome [Persicimonas caeni]QED34901.1 c-type cytochrome [Persicimonas caeni]